MNSLIFPTIFVFLGVASSVVYLINGDIKMFIYWACAAGLNASITYL